jgi:H+/Cl- antiporter ClcA
MTTGITRTISCAVIVFELTGQISHLLPVLVAVITARGVGKLLSPSIYESVLELHGVELLPPQVLHVYIHTYIHTYI